jgi:hypothetical protein
MYAHPPLDGHIRTAGPLPEHGNGFKQIVAARSHRSGEGRIFRSREICYSGFLFAEVNVYIKHVNQTKKIGNQSSCLGHFARGGDNSKMTLLFHFVTPK